MNAMKSLLPGKNALKNEPSHVFQHQFNLYEFNHTSFEFTGYNGRAGHLSSEAVENILQREAGVEVPLVNSYEGVVLIVDISAFTSTSQLTDATKQEERETIETALAKNKTIEKRNSKTRSKRNLLKSFEKTKSRVVKGLSLGRSKGLQRTNSELSEGFREKFPSLPEEDVPEATVEAADHLRGMINLYMQTFGQCCLSFGGEIAQITGDFMVCIWAPVHGLKVLEKHEYLAPLRPGNMKQAWRNAKACAASIIKKARTIQEQHFPSVTTLGVHGAMCEGSIVRLETKDAQSNKRLSFVYGEAVQIASSLMDFAKKYEIIAVEKGAKLCDTSVSGKFAVECAGTSVEKDILEAARNKSKGYGGMQVINEKSKNLCSGVPKVNRPLTAKDLTTEMIDAGLEEAMDGYIPAAVLDFMQESGGTADEPKQGMLLDCGVLFVLLKDMGPTKAAEFAPESKQWEATADSLGSAVAALNGILSDNGGHMINFSFDDKGCGLMAYFPGRLPIQAARRCKQEFAQSSIGVTKGRACYCYSGVPGERAIVAIYSKATSYAARIALSDKVKEDDHYNSGHSISVQASALKEFKTGELKALGLTRKSVDDPIEAPKERKGQQLLNIFGETEAVTEKFSAVIVNVNAVKAATKDNQFEENRKYLDFGHIKSETEE